MNLSMKGFLTAFVILPMFAIGCFGERADSDFPEGCVSDNYEYKDNNLILNLSSPEQSLFLFHNISDMNYWVDHPVTIDPGASAGWASTLNAGHWSALTVGKMRDAENFAISCATMAENGKLTYLDCKDVLKACSAENVKFKSGDNGSYWVAENQELNTLLKTIKSSGATWSD